MFTRTQKSGRNTHSGYRRRVKTRQIEQLENRVYLSGSDSDPSLIMHFPLDGDTVDTVTGLVGTLIGDAAFSDNVRSGCSGQSLFLDGSLDKVIVDRSDLEISAPFTVSVWANAAVRRPDATLAFVGTRAFDPGFDLKYLADNRIRADISDGVVGHGFTIVDTPVSYELNEWHHIAAVVDSSQYTLYYDGVAIATQGLGVNAFLLDADRNFTIGAVGPFLFPHGEDFHGWLDDVRVYNRALSAAEILTLMDCDCVQPCEPVLDQQHDFPPDAEGSIRAGIDRAQTFTVGVTGILSRIDLRVRRFDASTVSPLLVDIRSTTMSGAPAEPNSPVLASISVAAASIPIGSEANVAFSSFDLSAANLSVTEGDVLAIVLRSTDDYEWAKDNLGGYAEGSEFIRSSGTGNVWDLGALDDDFAFKTFVTTVCLTANDDDYTIDEDRTLSVDATAGVLGNDSGPTGSILSAVLVQGPSNGTLQLEADGSFTYTPAHDFFGTDTFTYTANDGLRVSNEATVTITVNSVLDAVIDVKPGSDLNPINLNNNGTIAVAILTTAAFDATTVDAATVLFADASATQWALEDVDSDGDTDLILHFRTQETNLRAIYEQLITEDINADGVLDSNHQQVSVSLTGMTTADELFEGDDEIDLFLSGKALRDLLNELAQAGAI